MQLRVNLVNQDASRPTVLGCVRDGSYLSGLLPKSLRSLSSASKRQNVLAQGLQPWEVAVFEIRSEGSETLVALLQSESQLIRIPRVKTLGLQSLRLFRGAEINEY